MSESRRVLKKSEQVAGHPFGPPKPASTKVNGLTRPQTVQQEILGLSAQLSLLYATGGEYTDAKRLAEKLFKALDLASPYYQSFWATALESLARVSVAEGNGAAALQHLRTYEAAQSRHRQALKAERDELRTKMVPEVRGRFAEFDRAMFDSVNYIQRAETAWLFGRAYSLVGQSREAATKFLEAVEIIENLRGFVGAEDRLTFFAKHTGP